MNPVLIFTRFILILFITVFLYACDKDDKEIINNSNNNNNNNPKDFRDKYLGDYQCRRIDRGLNDSGTGFVYYYSTDYIRFEKGEKDSDIVCLTDSFTHKINFKFQNDSLIHGDHYGGYFYKGDSVYMHYTPLAPMPIWHYGKKIIH